MAQVHKLNTTPLQNIRYGKLKKGVDTNIMPIRLVNEDGVQSNLYVQSPKLQLHTDVVENEHIRNFVDVESHESEFKDWVSNLEQKILNDLKLNKDVFFPNKGIDDVFLEAGQTSSIFQENLCKCRVMKDIQVYNYKKEQQDANSLKKGKCIVCIFQVVGVWFTTSRWGVTLKMIQARHDRDNTSSKIDKYMFPEEHESDLDDDDEDEQSILSPPPGV